MSRMPDGNTAALNDYQRSLDGPEDEPEMVECDWCGVDEREDEVNLHGESQLCDRCATKARKGEM